MDLQIGDARALGALPAVRQDLIRPRFKCGTDISLGAGKALHLIFGEVSTDCQNGQSGAGRLGRFCRQRRRHGRRRSNRPWPREGVAWLFPEVIATNVGTASSSFLD
jgi:hypothetical protein